MRPRVLILDEPTAGLDPDGQERLLATLGTLRESGTTVMMATHDVDLALRWADDAALLTPSGVRAGPAPAMLARTDLLEEAGLRLPWGIATARLLRAHGLLDASAPGPRTPEQLAGFVPGRSADGRARWSPARETFAGRGPGVDGGRGAGPSSKSSSRSLTAAATAASVDVVPLVEQPD